MEFDWRPGIGDPTFAGWATVVLYFLAAWSCLRTAHALRFAFRVETEGYSLWLRFAVLFLLLGINKQLDLQTAFTEVGRLIAHRYGWYDDRRAVQFVFVVLVGLVGAAAITYVVFRLRTSPFSTILTGFGVGFVIVFVVIRAASFHHFDEFRGMKFLGWRWNWILEMGGISLAIVGSWRRRIDLAHHNRRMRPHRFQPYGRLKDRGSAKGR